jgi:outer membrane biosynthesis protein TonB
MMSMGVASAKKSSFVNRERFRTPSYLTKMSRSKGMRSTKKEACLKLAEFTHNSTKRVSMDVVPALRQILQNDPEMRVMLIRKAELEEDELAYVMGVKSDSKVIKDAFKAASEAEVQEPKPERKEPVKRTVPKIDPPAPVAAEIPKPTEKPKPTAPRSGQKSLFDF